MAQAEFKNRYPFQVFTVSIMIFIVLAWTTAFYIYPSISHIEEKKSQLLTLLKEKSDVEMKWITYSDFSSLRTASIIDNSYESNILRTIEEEFYNEKIKNNTTGNFEAFFSQLSTEVNAQKSDKVQEKRQLIINSLLPQYVDVSDARYEWLTEFKFVNYVETLLYAFNLSVDNSIGISEVAAYETSSKKESTESIDSTLFYIPLFLKINWRKEDIIDFLYLIENIWALKMENGVLEVHNDDKLDKKVWLILWRNIYKNQLFTVETLRMQEYLDSDNSPTEKDFVSYVRELQWREKISVELGLRYYVRGLPNYQVKWYIKDLVKKQEDLNKKINVRLKEVKKLNTWDSSEVLISINTIKNLSFWVVELWKEIVKLNTSLGKQQTLNQWFKEALTLGDRIQSIETSLLEESDKIDFYKKNKK